MSDSLLHRLAARLFGREAHVDAALVADLERPEPAPEPVIAAQPAFERIDSNATEQAWFRPAQDVPLGRDPVDSSPDTSRWWRRPAVAVARARPKDGGSEPDAA